MLSFRPIEARDFPLLLAWLATPHVREWWDDGDDTLAKVAAHYGDDKPDRARYMLIETVANHETPIGYFQYYIISPTTIGIDQFIGDAAYLGRGIGSDAIRQFIALICAQHTPHEIILNPHPANQRAIRCYTRVGFVHDPEHPENSATCFMMRLPVPISDTAS